MSLPDYPEAFCIAVNGVLAAEGGYVNDPRDPGGETRFGISKRAYPDLDIAALQLPEAIAIYFRDYWLRCGCQHMPAHIAAPLFDSAVNQGVRAAIEMLQKTLRVTVDGVIGKQTVGAAHGSTGVATLAEFTTLRVLRYVGTANFNTYGRGWILRALTIALKAVRL